MTETTPKKEGYFQPAEWEPHASCWVAWPSHGDLWLENLKPAQDEFTALCKEIGASENLNVLVPTLDAKAAAEKALAGLPVTYHSIPFGDIWLRDIAPIFLKNAAGGFASVRFSFNGWGEKYILPHDREVSSAITKASGLKNFSFKPFLEGGALEVDGEGTCLTTEQCLLNPNRNPKMSRTENETLLCDALGVKKILWLKKGLMNDHTDGHIDTIVRFSKPGTVLCMQSQDRNDPNFDVMEELASDLAQMTDAKGRTLEVIRIPGPGTVLNEDGEIMPASYLNFYISNRSVIVPIYGSKHDDEAVRAIAECFPGRNTVGLSAKAILAGGGAFHCITQQEPS